MNIGSEKSSPILGSKIMFDIFFLVVDCFGQGDTKKSFHEFVCPLFKIENCFVNEIFITVSFSGSSKLMSGAVVLHISWLIGRNLNKLSNKHQSYWKPM